jgi:hypothetical protein
MGDDDTMSATAQTIIRGGDFAFRSWVQLEVEDLEMV